MWILHVSDFADRESRIPSGGLSMILAGASINGERTMRVGAWGMAMVYGVVGLFSLPLFHSMIHKYGFHLTLVLGLVGRLLQQYVVVAACAILATMSKAQTQRHNKEKRTTHFVFGVSGILFGLSHLVNPNGVS